MGRRSFEALTAPSELLTSNSQSQSSCVNPPPFEMGLITKTFKLATMGGAAAVGAFAFGTRNSNFVPVSSADPIFGSAAYLKNNPNKNPATHDLCIKKVPLSQIKPQLLESEGKLVEAFCAGVWSGLGNVPWPRLPSPPLNSLHRN
jgi:hypothetical protein